jgi:hypothetical protein
LGGGRNFVAKTKVNKKRSRQRTTKGVSNGNVLARAFHCCYRIGGGGVSTMGRLVPNFGEGGSVGILVILVEVLFFLLCWYEGTSSYAYTHAGFLSN